MQILYCEIRGVASGRVGDYSRASAVFVGVYQREGESVQRASVYSLIDEENRWNAPHPKFTSSGGKSPEVLHHLRHIFYKHRVGDTKKVVFPDESNGHLSFFLSSDGDIIVGTENANFKPGYVISFAEGHPLYQDLLLLCELIDRENIANPTRNPFSDPVARKRLEPVNLFP